MGESFRFAKGVLPLGPLPSKPAGFLFGRVDLLKPVATIFRPFFELELQRTKFFVKKLQVDFAAGLHCVYCSFNLLSEQVYDFVRVPSQLDRSDYKRPCVEIMNWEGIKAHQNNVEDGPVVRLTFGQWRALMYEVLPGFLKLFDNCRDSPPNKVDLGIAPLNFGTLSFGSLPFLLRNWKPDGHIQGDEAAESLSPAGNSLVSVHPGEQFCHFNASPQYVSVPVEEHSV